MLEERIWPGSATPGTLVSLQSVARRLSESLPLEHAAAVASEAAWSTLDTSIVVVAALDDAGPHLRAVYAKGLRDAAAPRPSTLLAKAWAALEPGQPLVHQAGDLSVTALPIPPAGRPTSVLLAGRPLDRPFTEDEQAYLTVLSALLGLALQRLRRHRSAGSHLRVGDLEIDLGQQCVTAGDRQARLTPSEIRLLLFLAEEPGRPRTRGEILRRLWHTDHVVDERACDVHISHLRRKIERDPSRPQRLVTVRNVGYALRPAPAM